MMTEILFYYNFLLLERCGLGVAYIAFGLQELPPMDRGDDVGPAREGRLGRVRGAGLGGMVGMRMKEPDLIQSLAGGLRNFFVMLFGIDQELKGAAAPQALLRQADRAGLHEL
jgi:hypothetical protein